MQLFNKFVSVFITFTLIGCTMHRSSVFDESRALSNSSEVTEVNLGRQIHESIVSRIPISKDLVSSDYATEVGSAISHFAVRRKLEYRFVLLEDTRVYATFAPGGYVYITTGLMRYLENESELAWVIAHEIGELQYKDPRLSKALAALERLIEGGALVAPAFGAIGAVAMGGLVMAHLAMDRAVSRDKRLKIADRLALTYMTQAGFDPQAALNLTDRLGHASLKDHMLLHDFFQSRPILPERVDWLAMYYNQLDLNEKTFDVNRQHFLLMTKNLR